jgi:prolyl-tRNA synthetase
MGSYGVGVTRSMQAIVEQKHDDNGILWSENTAPFKLVIIIANMQEEVQINLAEEIYEELLGKNIEVILDDREERAGVKFKDADLIGFPYRITVGKKAVDGLIEFKKREDKDFIFLNKIELLEKF